MTRIIKVLELSEARTIVGVIAVMKLVGHFSHDCLSKVNNSRQFRRETNHNSRNGNWTSNQYHSDASGAQVSSNHLTFKGSNLLARRRPSET